MNEARVLRIRALLLVILATYIMFQFVSSLHLFLLICTDKNMHG